MTPIAYSPQTPPQVLTPQLPHKVILQLLPKMPCFLPSGLKLTGSEVLLDFIAIISPITSSYIQIILSFHLDLLKSHSCFRNKTELFLILWLKCMKNGFDAMGYLNIMFIAKPHNLTNLLMIESSKINHQLNKIRFSNKASLRLTPEEREKSLKPLLENGWIEVKSGDAIKKNYSFKNFNQAFGFMTQVALAAEKNNHHPEWTNVFNSVDIIWTTHSSQGLTSKDLKLAKFCDSLHSTPPSVKAAPCK